MPTAAKLFAAVAFAMLGFVAAEIGKGLLPEGTQVVYFAPYCALIGAACGWFVMGRLTGQGTRAAIESALRTLVTQLFYTLMGLSIYEMTLQSMKLRYDGPMQAVQGMFDILSGYLKLMVNGPLIVVLVIGALIAGMLAEWAGRRWR